MTDPNGYALEPPATDPSPRAAQVLHNHEERLAALELALPHVFPRLDALELALPAAILHDPAGTLGRLEAAAAELRATLPHGDAHGCPYGPCLFRGATDELAAHLVSKHGRSYLTAEDLEGAGEGAREALDPFEPVHRDRTDEGPPVLAVGHASRLACGCWASEALHHALCVVAAGQPISSTTLLEQGVDPADAGPACG